MEEVVNVKVVYRIQLFIQLIVGLGALFGGGMAIYDPYGVLYGMPVDVLKKGPFTSFLIPGLFLFAAIGLVHLLSFAAVKRRLRFHSYISCAAGCILIGWILIQCYIIQSVHYLHIIFFTIGLLEGVIALYMLYKCKLFPFSKSFHGHLEG